MAIATRRAAWRDGSANGWHDDLVWYAAAMHQMKALTPALDEFLGILGDALQQRLPAPLINEMASIARQWDDPLSLGYHSQVHGTFVAKSAWPTVNGSRALWQECAHNHWFFLPWHRAYLLEFEAVAREHIKRLGGPSEQWALPYWNYSDHQVDPRRLGLPTPLRGDTLPDGVSVPGVEAEADGSFRNPLYNPIRDMIGDPDPGNVWWADAADALLRPHYANQQDTGRVSFGGGVLENPNDPALFHDRTRELGQLDAQPHGSVHGEINGSMALFQTAGLDPVFWIHHCNIDRLWETFADELGHGYPFEDGTGAGTPAQQSWIDQQFRFLRPDGSVATWRAPEVIVINSLGYEYDTTAPPQLPAVPPSPLPGSEIDPFGLDVSIPEPVASAASTSLAGERDVMVAGGTGDDQGVGLDSFPEDANWVLRFDGLRAATPVPTSYQVYLGVPPGGTADPLDADHYVGLLSLFGVYEASRDDGSSPGDGQRRQLDVTSQVRAQAATLRPLAARVRLVPLNPGRDLEAPALSIERITLEFG